MPPDSSKGAGQGPYHILCVAYDNGGMNLLAAMLRDWADDPDIVADFASAKDRVATLSATIPNLRIPPWADLLELSSCIDSDVGDALDQQKIVLDRYSAIFTATSHQCGIERHFQNMGRRQGIPTFAICDMWSAYEERFSDDNRAILPDFIFAIDQRMADGISSALTLGENQIIVTGSPMYDEMLASRGVAAPLGDNFVYVSEPASTTFPLAGIDEFVFADQVLLAATKLGLSHRLLFRPHPLEPTSAWLNWLDAQPGCQAKLDQRPLHNLYSDTGRAIGISSILLTQLALQGIPTASLQPQGVDKNYYCLPFEDFGIQTLGPGDSIERFLIDKLPPPKLSENIVAHLGARKRIKKEILRRCQPP